MALSSATDTTDYMQKVYKYMKLFGRPPQWLETADPSYLKDLNVGRTYSEAYLANPTIVSLCPCEAKFMPKVDKKEQETFVQSVQSSFNEASSKIAQDAASDMSGKFYKTVGCYSSYINEVNVTLRLIAINMGIGDKMFPGTSTPYKQFSWDYYMFGGKSIFAKGEEASAKQSGQIPFLQGLSTVTSALSEAGKRAVNAVIDDWTWAHFYADGDGTSNTEDIQTTTTSSMIEKLINESSLNEYAKELNFLVGGKISDKAIEDYDKAIGKMGDSWLSSFLRGSKGYLEGSRLVFPDILDSVQYGKSATFTVKCKSYGDPESVYLYLMVPLAHILPFAVPGQYNTNMYKFPFLCKCYSRGYFNSDLACITNLRVTKGGSDNLSWTLKGLPTELEFSFDVTPLYSSLMMSSASHPFAAIQNQGLTEYLAALTGVELVGDTAKIRSETIKTLLFNKPKDIAHTVYNNLIDDLSNSILGDFFKLI